MWFQFPELLGIHFLILNEYVIANAPIDRSRVLSVSPAALRQL
jgi:hypothetical protein